MGTVDAVLTSADIIFSAGNSSAAIGGGGADSTAPTVSAYGATATTVTTTLTSDTGVIGLYTTSGGTTLATGVTAGTITGSTTGSVTAVAQNAVTTTYAQVLDAAGNIATNKATVILGTTGNDNAGFTGTANADIVFGFAGNDTIDISATAGADTVIGGAGADTITVGSGANTVILAAGDTQLTISLGTGGSTNSSITGFDTVTGLVHSNGTVVSEILDVPGTASLYAPAGTVDFANVAAAHGVNGDASSTFAALRVTNGIVTFYADDGATTPVTVDEYNVAGAISVLQSIDLGNTGTTVAISSQWGHRLYVFTQGTDDGLTNSLDTLVMLEGNNADGVDALIIGTNTAGTNDLFIM